MDVGEHVIAAGLSDPGMVRSNNEDSIAYDLSHGILILADGMGGYSGGEVASGIAVQVITDYLQEHLSSLKKIGEIDNKSGFTYESLLAEQAISLANVAIKETALQDPQRHQMGTTIVVVIFYDNRMTVAHIGDSRLYRRRHQQLEQITRDHSLLQELVDKGFYTEEEARSSLNKNVLTRALGTDDAVKIDKHEEVVLPEDLYLLCTDGLSDMLLDKEIDSLLVEAGNQPEEAVMRLVSGANNAGGLDNVSVVVARVESEFSVKRAWYNKVLDWFFE